VNALRGRAASVLIGLATALVIVTVAILPFLTPQWVGFEQGRANATAWTGYTTEELRTATDSILSDLVFGPPDFDVVVRGEVVLDERERGHMRDVGFVFLGLWVVGVVSILVLVGASRRRDRRSTWRAVGGGALGLTAVVVGVGAVALVAFDALFDLFHRIFFPAGSFTFDPATERLVQLFPVQFWEESTLAVGTVIVAAALATALVAARRAARSSQHLVGADPGPTPDPTR
jgi:integral membrane protein (TIGR01906 family)